MSTRPLILCSHQDRDTVNALVTALGSMRYDVRGATTGKETLQALRRGFPDVIVVGAEMPDINAPSLCAAIRRRNALAHIPIIVLGPSRAEPAAFLATGANEYIREPSPEEVSVNVQRLLGQSFWGRLWTNPRGSQRQIVKTGLPRFKDFLLARIGESGEVAAIVRAAPVKGLYGLASHLGVSNRRLANWIAEFFALPFLERIDPGAVHFEGLPGRYCRTNTVLALKGERESSLVLANPFDWETIETLAEGGLFDRPPRAFVAAPEDILSAIKERLRQDEGASSQSIGEILERLRKRQDSEETNQSAQSSASDSDPIVLLVNRVIEDAYEAEASDIHIEPFEDMVLVRYRVDGDLRVMHRLRPPTLIRPLISRIKVMSGLDISERRLPQDGRIPFKKFTHRTVDFDLRVATSPMNFGEKVVMRIVDKEKSVLPLSCLGFSSRNLEMYRECIRTPYGMILHVGPTGSGKSMTLYAALNEIQRPEINIQTAEDPIEYSVPGINQLQVQSEIGLTFSRALRSYLRQDPDVILLGEIRDLTTAEIAVEAALTGHLLVSTLHTNDAPSAITRLVHMGIAPFMVSSSIVLICAQRLLRRLCTVCRSAMPATDDEKRLIGFPRDYDAVLWRPRGCPSCGGIGYKGRIGIHEVLVPDDSLRMAVNQRGITAEALKKMAVEQCDMTTLYWDAMGKVRQGITSVEEVISKVRPDEFDSRPDWMFSDLEGVEAR